MKRHYRKIIIGSFVAVAACIVMSFMLIMVFSNDDDTYSLATFETVNGYLFDIRAESFWEVTQPILCIGMKGEEIVFPLKVIGYTEESRELEFDLIEGGEKKELIALVEKSAPYVVLALYELTSQEYGVYWSGWQKERKLMKELLQRLNDKDSEQLFVLPHDAEDDVEQKIN
jgi:hypothetical protein